MESKMKRNLISFFSFVMACVWVTTIAYAVPNLISYQGVLNDSSGNPLSTTVSMTFSIYGVASGGTALWSETQSVQVSNGVFNVKLGSIQALTSSVFQADTLFLGVQVGADPEMTPRQQITSGAYAHKAEAVSHAAIPIGTIMAWAKNFTGVPALSNGWVECNGQMLNDVLSPLNGQVIPDLNGTNGAKRFLRGAHNSGALGGSDTHEHPMKVDSNHDGGGIPGIADERATLSASSLPSYYEVVWIMKVK